MRSERARREEAQANKGNIVEGSGTRASPKRLTHMVSVRLEPGLVSELGAVARQRGVALSEVLREGAKLLLVNREKERPKLIWEMTLEEEIAAAINRACAENESSTPDFILASYLMDCLTAFNKATNKRIDWYDDDGTIRTGYFVRGRGKPKPYALEDE